MQDATGFCSHFSSISCDNIEAVFESVTPEEKEGYVQSFACCCDSKMLRSTHLSYYHLGRDKKGLHWAISCF
ncbi:hypothetical protein LIER_03654 [Lithospermum erythrorhizon]|uniref:Uncharacterized protein n=1 Tax=Lithospermum erythrorhizon TaxID=34254 RepID=A0AAV3NV73_LITER